MELSSAIVFFFFFLLCYFLISSYSVKPKHKLPPEAGGARPILGHLHLMDGGRGDQLPHMKLGTLADKLGPIFTIRLGTRRAVVVSSWKIAKELFTTHDVTVSDRPKLRASKHLSNNFSMFGFGPYGAYWRDLRKLVSIKLLSNRRVDLLSHVMLSEIALSVKELYTCWEEGKKDGSGRVLVDLKKWIEELNLNMILRIVARKRIARDGADEMRRCSEVMKDFFKLAGTFVAADALPWLRWLDLGGYEKWMKETAKEFDRIVGKWVEEHRRSKDSDEDFIDVMLSAVQSSDFGNKFDNDTVIKSTCQGMILGGSDTSSVALTWALSLLLNNRHALIKAQEELDKHIGRGRMVKESDIHNLVYLQSIIKETLRLYPPGPFGPTREFNQECNIEGCCIPKGTWLLVNIWKLQRDPEVWPDNPLEFKPERFLSTHRNVDIKGQDFELIPFGAGRRMCPGVNLATHIMPLMLGNLLQAFDMTTLFDADVDMTESAGMTNPKATPLEVLLAPRLSSNLY